MKHTPGPWRSSARNVYSKELNTVIAQCWDQTIFTDEPEPLPARANAYLIAAAPDLLEACEAEERSVAINKEYYKQCDLGMSPSEGWEKLTYTDTITAEQRASELRKNAIAKARGEE